MGEPLIASSIEIVCEREKPWNASRVQSLAKRSGAAFGIACPDLPGAKVTAGPYEKSRPEERGGCGVVRGSGR